MEEIINNKDLKVIRLDNGEILFSLVKVTEESKNNGYLELHWPMKVHIRYDDEKQTSQLALLKWLPFTDSTTVPIAAKCIMTVSNLGEEFKPFYLDSIKEASEEGLDEELTKMSKILADFEYDGLMN